MKLAPEFADQPRVRLEPPRPKGDKQVAVAEPVCSLEPDGGAAEVAARIPHAVENDFVRTLDSGVVLRPPGQARVYLLTDGGALVVDHLDGSPNVVRRAGIDWQAMRSAGPLASASEPVPVALAIGQRIGYWHWWVDVISRVWMVERMPAHTGIRWAFPDLGTGFRMNSLEMVGVGERLVELQPGTTDFSSVTFSSGVTPGRSRFPTPAIREFSAWLRQAAVPGEGERLGTGRRLYVSRGDAKSRRVSNEGELTRALAERGFETIVCAELPLEEQVARFASASTVVGPHGAGLTNLLFSGPGTRVVELFSAAGALDISNYRIVASHLGFPYARVLGKPVAHERRSNHDLDMEVDPRNVLRALDELGVD